MRPLDTRLSALEKAASPVPAYRMLIGETEHAARTRLGIAEGVEVLFIQRVIVTPRAGQGTSPGLRVA